MLVPLLGPIELFVKVCDFPIVYVQNGTYLRSVFAFFHLVCQFLDPTHALVVILTPVT